jgi:hypothetical protein
MLDRWLSELDERNRDNVARTESYLELYTYTRTHGPELPWLLMAHLVSRNAGYFMTDLRRVVDDRRTHPDARPIFENLFHLLERANFLIFWDAWHHVLSHMLGRPFGARTAQFMQKAWARFDRDPTERRLALDLVHNEQHYIEHRAAHHPRFAAGLVAVIGLELTRRDQPLHFPCVDVDIRVGRFRDLGCRIEAGRRIFDEVVADRAQRDAIFRWCDAHPHTGARSVIGGKRTTTLREAWPVAEVRARFSGVHDPAEPDPRYA